MFILKERLASMKKIIDKKLDNVKEITKSGAEMMRQFSPKTGKIVTLTISSISILLALSLMAVYFLELKDKHYIMQTFITSLFSILTLTMAFIASSGIGKK